VPPVTWQAALWVALGGAIGSVLRWATVALAAEFFGIGFPWGTLIVNLAGSFIIGIVAGLAMAGVPSVTPTVRLFVATGVLGGFTTFSAFSLDAVNLSRDGGGSLALTYVTSSVVLGIAAAYAGLVVVRAIRSHA
jgi:fluoride exporter